MPPVAQSMLVADTRAHTATIASFPETPRSFLIFSVTPLITVGIHSGASFVTTDVAHSQRSFALSAASWVRIPDSVSFMAIAFFIGSNPASASNCSLTTLKNFPSGSSSLLIQSFLARASRLISMILLPLDTAVSRFSDGFFSRGSDGFFSRGSDGFFSASNIDNYILGTSILFEH